jgi:hypothetical protein
MSSRQSLQALRPGPEKIPVVSWPGGNCDVKAQQTLFTDTLAKAARHFGVRLELRDAPLGQPEEVREYLDRDRTGQCSGHSRREGFPPTVHPGALGTVVQGLRPACRNPGVSYRLNRQGICVNPCL